MTLERSGEGFVQPPRPLIARQGGGGDLPQGNRMPLSLALPWRDAS